MKPLAMVLLYSSALVVLALLAIGVMFSITAGKPNWILIAVFGVDTVALLVLAARATVSGSRPGDDRRRNH